MKSLPTRHTGAGADEPRYLVDLRVRNFSIVKALADIGHTPLSFAKHNHLNAQEVYGLVNMTLSPFPCSRTFNSVPDESRYRKSVLAIMLATRKPFDALFNEQQAQHPLTTNRAEAGIDEPQLLEAMRVEFDLQRLTGDLATPISPEDELMQAEGMKFDGYLDLLTGRRGAGRMKRLLTLKYVHDCTLAEIADMYGISPERVRTIISDGLRIIHYRLCHDGSNNAALLGVDPEW